MTEDAAILKATGSLTITDTDTGEDKFDTAKDYTGTYGALTITADGDWEYTLDNTGSAVQGLKQDQVVTDVITVYALDGSATEDITITITGTNDGPTVASAINASISDDSGIVSVALLSGATDEDVADTLTVTGLTLKSGDATGITGNADNTLSVEASSYKHLGDGQELRVIY